MRRCLGMLEKAVSLTLVLILGDGCRLIWWAERVCLALISLITVSKVFALLQFNYRL